MKFSSRKSVFFRILILGCVGLLTIFPVLGVSSGWIGQRDFWILIPFSVMITFLLWLYLGTNYQLTAAELIYRSGPFRGKIRIEEIREIVTGKTLYAGFKPATSEKGLIIKYNKYDEIYISPDSNETFIAEILKRNPEILISE